MKTLTFVDADVNANAKGSTIGLCECFSGELKTKQNLFSSLKIKLESCFFVFFFFILLFFFFKQA